MEISLELQHRLITSQHWVFFTGAGISAESGIPTFRQHPEGLWQQYDPRRLASREGFQEDRELVWSWYQERRRTVAASEPNAAHRAIAAIEALPRQVTVITQNIDGYHHAAGSSVVWELHGSLLRNRCFACERQGPRCQTNTEGLMHCQHCGGYLRPDVVWFGESLPGDVFRSAAHAMDACDVFVVIGTSGEVQPAASLPPVAKELGKLLLVIDPLATPYERIADIHLRMVASAGVGQLLNLLRQSGL